jgi:hypothetical protein
MRKPYKHLSQNEREELAQMFWEQKRLGEIAEALNRAKSTISRELKRNSAPKYNRYTPCRDQLGGFHPTDWFSGGFVFEEGTGFGRGAPSFFILDADGFQSPINGGGRDGLQGLSDLRGQIPEDWTITGKP